MKKRKKLPVNFWKDRRWILKHYQYLSKEYADKWIAVVDSNVVSYGNDIGIVKKKATLKTGKKHFPVMFIEKGIHVYYGN